MYFPRGVVHQAVSTGDHHSLHLTFSTYQRHTWADLLTPALPTTRKVQRAFHSLLASSGRIHDDLPLNTLTRPTVGRAQGTWRVWKGGIATRVSSGLYRALKAHNSLGGAIDALALDFIVKTLPPPPMEKPGDVVEGVDVEEQHFIRLVAPHCAWLIDERKTGATLQQWSRLVDGDETKQDAPALRLRSNVLNGRAFTSPPAPSFEVLPWLAKAVTQLIENGAHEGLQVSSLRTSPAMRADLLDLLSDLNDNGVVVVTSSSTA
mmetsp:Transcript_34607/g.80937  ORF Transcript_34607/g.80937 Transcript_34607/m.80937 type:complete len:263 (+) Transcript_34607:2-790(+)